jgi:paraquat-inducible protein B
VNDSPRTEVKRTEAAVRRTWWPGWIWAIPLAALLLVGWWLLREVLSGGEDVTITFADAHGVKQDSTSVVYRGIKVGSVKSVSLAKDGKSVDVAVHLDDSVTMFLKSGTRFWLRGAQTDLSDLSTLSAVISGPTIVIAPGPGEKATHFAGLEHEPTLSGTDGEPQLYAVSLSGDVGRLKEGAPVKLRGFTVGEVKDIGFHYDEKTGAIATPVTLALDPALFPLTGGGAAAGKAELAQAIDRLIRSGLHARLERDPPLIGSSQVTLESEPGGGGEPPPALSGMPQIPAASDGGITSIVDRINKLPLDEIGKNVLEVTHHVNDVVASPKLTDAINELDDTLKQVHQTADEAGPKIATLVDSLRKTAGQLDQAAKAADKVLGGTPVQTGAQDTMHEITAAARSVRELANYLDRHPEALIKGRSGD